MGKNSYKYQSKSQSDKAMKAPVCISFLQNIKNKRSLSLQCANYYDENIFMIIS